MESSTVARLVWTWYFAISVVYLGMSYILTNIPSYPLGRSTRQRAKRAIQIVRRRRRMTTTTTTTMTTMSREELKKKKKNERLKSRNLRNTHRTMSAFPKSERKAGQRIGRTIQPER